MSGPGIRALTASALLPAAICACGAADDSGVDLPPQAIPIEGCEQYSYVGCPVLESACRENVMGLVSCLRGNDPSDLPPVRILTEAEYRAELEPGTVTIIDPADARYEQAMVWLGLVPRGGLSDQAVVEDQLAELRPYYSSETGTITFITPDDASLALGEEDATLTLAHETVHALQDRHVDLSARWDAIAFYDAALAMRSVIEGEAMIYETLIDAAFWSLDPGQIHLDQRFDAQLAETDAHVTGDPAPYLDSFYWFPYTYGARFVYDAYAAGGSAAVRALPLVPPGGTLPIFQRGAPAVEASPWPAAPAGPGGETDYMEESIGAWLLYVKLQRAQVPGAREIAQSWRADRLWIYGDAERPTGMLWRIRFAGHAEAVVAASALDAALVSTTGGTVRTLDLDVGYFVATSSSVVTWADAVMPP